MALFLTGVTPLIYKWIEMDEKHDDSPLVHKRCFCGFNRGGTDCTQLVK